MDKNYSYLDKHSTSYGAIKRIGNKGAIIVGKFCSIAPKVTMVSSGHRIHWLSTFPFGARIFRGYYPEAKKLDPVDFMGDLHIMNDVWVGYRTTFCGCNEVQNGAVIAAGSVVTKDVGPYEIWAGNPAYMVGKRFTTEQICDLLRIQWWDWPIEKIRENLVLICNGDIDQFINIHRR